MMSGKIGMRAGVRAGMMGLGHPLTRAVPAMALAIATVGGSNDPRGAGVMIGVRALVHRRGWELA
jgi:hypothetical protein